MKIGVIFCGYNMAEYAVDSIMPWVEAKAYQTGGYSFVLSAVSVPFANYPAATSEDETGVILKDLESRNSLDKVFTEPRNINEWEARDLCLQYLLKQKVDLVWQVDLDEFYTLEDIENILKFVEKDAMSSWFKISFKNYAFDKSSYLSEPFTPPRIHRTTVYAGHLHKFIYDNDLSYKRHLNGEEISHNSVAFKLIPRQVAWVKHLTWLNDSRSRDKVKYHTDRGWLCSYSWDEEKGLQFNDKYFDKNNLHKPLLLKE